MARPKARKGAAHVEFVLLTAGVVFPLIFGIIYLSELLWTWQSMIDFTRDGARYAATHCWEGGDNVIAYMQQNVPPIVDQNQFTGAVGGTGNAGAPGSTAGGSVTYLVNYFALDPTTGLLGPFSCDSECSTSCIPDAVTVAVSGYQFQNFVSYLGLPPVVMPSFQTSTAMQGAGCDPEQAACLP
jgi:Flp pilus assembly protein TadG